MLKDKKVGFIGGGQVCEAILSGALDAEVLTAANVCVTDLSAGRLAHLAERYGVETLPNDAEESGAKKLLARSELVVLAVKPQFAPGILKGIGAAFTKQQLVISVVGATRLQTIESYIPLSPVIRVMPNTPMFVRRGSAAVCLGSRATEAHLALCRQLFDALGTSYVIDEDMINTFTAVGGCGPAFAYIFIQALADGGVEQGLSREMAQQVAAEVLVGAGEMVLKTGTHPERLKDNVCSPGGGSIAGVHALEKQGLRGIVMDAAAKARQRMDELGKKTY